MVKKFFNLLQAFRLFQKKRISADQFLYLNDALSQRNFTISYFYILASILKYLEYSYENKKIVFFLDDSDRKIPYGIKFSNRQKQKLINLLCFSRQNLHFDNEALSIIRILKKIGFSFDADSSNGFYSKYLYSRIKHFYDYRRIFEQLSAINFQMNHVIVPSRFVNRRLLDGYDKSELFSKLDMEINLAEPIQRMQFLTALGQPGPKTETFDGWVEFFMKEFKDSINVHNDEFVFLLTILSNTKNEKLKQYVLSKCNPSSFLHDLIINDYSFSQVNISSKETIMQMNIVVSLKDFILLSLGKSNRHLVFTFSNNLFKDKLINFSLMKLFPIFKNEDVNFVYTVLKNKKFDNLPSYIICEKDLNVISHIIQQFSSTKKVRFIEDLFDSFYLFREIRINYEKIVEKNEKFKIKIKYRDMSHFLDYVSLEHESHYFSNMRLNQIQNFPVLSKIDGLTIDDLRFEVPKTKYDLYNYGNKMVNCIYTYYDKCELKSSIIIGVYKNSKLEYNIELGTEYSEMTNLTNVFNEDIIQYGSDRFNLYKPKRSKPRKIIQFEKRYKQQVPLDDDVKIKKILIDLNLID